MLGSRRGCMPLRTAGSGAGAVVAWWWRTPLALLSTLAVGFLASGAALAADARECALHSSVRQILDQEFGGFLIESIGPAGQHDPMPIAVTLVEDAAPRDGFVSLRADLLSVQLRGRWEAAAGGVAISVNGVAAAERVTEWRAGRVIEAPITFRRPTRYLNDGVPDFERDQALDGITLLGTVKSGLLIDVVRTGTMWPSGPPTFANMSGAPSRRWIEPYDSVSAAIASAVLIGDRTGLPDETREALASRRHLSRHRHLRRQHCDPGHCGHLMMVIVGVRGRQPPSSPLLFSRPTLWSSPPGRQCGVPR